MGNKPYLKPAPILSTTCQNPQSQQRRKLRFLLILSRQERSLKNQPKQEMDEQSLERERRPRRKMVGEDVETEFRGIDAMRVGGEEQEENGWRKICQREGERERGRKTGKGRGWGW